MSEIVLLFRGEVQSPGPGEIIVDALCGGAGSVRLQMEGTLTDAVQRVARLASRPRGHDELVMLLERELSLAAGVASTLIAKLVEAGVLASEVNTATRLRIEGQSDLADRVRHQLARELWPAQLEGMEIAVLGRLGSAGWRAELSCLAARQTRALTCSFEGSACWIGPYLDGRAGPCPLCLLARRAAARAEHEAPVTLSSPPHLALVAALLRQVAEGCARGEIAADRVLHVEGTTSVWRTLLPQPYCEFCDPERLIDLSSLGEQARRSEQLLASALAVGGETVEPSCSARAAWLDPELGPLRLEVYEARGSFRELPLVLGSIRTAQPLESSFVRREFASVMFGTGNSEQRRKLVAFSEGVERYAGSLERPDVVGVPFERVSRFALQPSQTVRFLDEQYDGRSLVRYDAQPTDWSWACDWTTGRSRLLLHDVIACAERPGDHSFHMFQDPFTSGMAAHRSLSLALSRAVLELIERDALMLTWYLRLPLRAIDLSALVDAELFELTSYLSAGGVKLRFYDMRVDFSVPCVLAVAEASRDFGAWKTGGVIVSACAGLSFAEALRHAAREILGHYTVFALVSPDGDKSVDPETGQARPWWPAFASFLAPRADDPLGFLGGGPSEARLSQPEHSSITLAQLREELREREIPVYVRQLGRRDVRQSGLVAIRAVAPGLVRLTPTRESVNFGEPRWQHVAARWGVAPTKNPGMHPLS
jgi:ribosomal protein S12 methylthiotransferase accessory factor